MHAKGSMREFMRLSEEWCDIRGCSPGSDFHNEFVAIKELLHNFRRLDVEGTCVHIEKKIVGFAIGERLNDDTYVEHFEKGDINYKGVYQFVFNEFSKRIPERFKFINREQDLGVEGLRKAKESYSPVKMIEKFSISAKR